jgi:tyrosine-protein phosphatase YwqE
MNIFFKPKKRTLAFGTVFHTDMHSHILPGIDDGSPDLETSVFLVEGLIRNGYQRLIATPHIMSDHYPNSTHTIKEALNVLLDALQKKGISIPIVAAAEYMLDDNFQKLLTADDLLTFGDNFILVETFFQSLPPYFQDLLFQLQLKNYRVVLAHPERYHYIDEGLKFLEDLKDKGVYLQANALSFTGYYGRKEKMIAEKMLDADLIDFIGTDMHHQRHLKALERSTLPVKVIEKLEKIQLNSFPPSTPSEG